MLIIRRAAPSDLHAITEIYNEAILNSISTMDTIVQSLDDRQTWLEQHGESYPVLVGEENGSILGWASLTKWSEKQGYSPTAEASVFIHKDHRGKSVGKRLLKELIVVGETEGFHLLVARIASSNSISLSMCRKLGFTDVGIMTEAGHKFGNYIDISVLQYLYS